MATRKAIRRVVTGHNDEGQAVILFDGEAPNTFQSETIPGFGATVTWYTPAGIVDYATDADAAPAEIEFTFPKPGETIMRIADFPPDAVYPKDAGDAIFDEIDGHDERDAGSGKSNSHFWFHRTESIDYAIVLDGEITLIVDDGETTVRTGDVIIQRATSHAWSNRTDKIARMLFVLVGTEPISPADIAAQRTKAVALGQA